MYGHVRKFATLNNLWTLLDLTLNCIDKLCSLHWVLVVFLLLQSGLCFGMSKISYYLLLAIIRLILLRRSTLLYDI